MFNNAGIMHAEDADAISTPENIWDLTMNINVKGISPPSPIPHNLNLSPLIHSDYTTPLSITLTLFDSPSFRRMVRQQTCPHLPPHTPQDQRQHNQHGLDRRAPGLRNAAARLYRLERRRAGVDPRARHCTRQRRITASIRSARLRSTRRCCRIGSARIKRSGIGEKYIFRWVGSERRLSRRRRCCGWRVRKVDSLMGWSLWLMGG